MGTHRRYAISLSFSGRDRDRVRELAERLAQQFGRWGVFFDEFHDVEMARVELGANLQARYGDSELIVVVLSKAWKESRWCGLEWDAIKEVAKAEPARVMFVTFEAMPPDPAGFAGVGRIEAGLTTEAIYQRLVEQRDRLTGQRYLYVHVSAEAPSGTPPHLALLRDRVAVSAVHLPPNGDLKALLRRHRPSVVDLAFADTTAWAWFAESDGPVAFRQFSVSLLIVTGQVGLEAVESEFHDRVAVVAYATRPLDHQTTARYLHGLARGIALGQSIGAASRNANGELLVESFGLSRPEAAEYLYVAVRDAPPAGAVGPQLAIEVAPVRDAPPAARRSGGDEGALASGPRHPPPPHQHANGRVWCEDTYWLAHVRAVDPAEFATVHDAALDAFRDRPADRRLGPAGLLVIKPSGVLLGLVPADSDAVTLRRLFADVQALRQAASVPLAVGLARGSCSQWPTPLLQQDAIGEGVVDAMRASAASAAQAAPYADGAMFAVLEEPHQSILRGLGMTIGADGRRPGAVEDPARLLGAARQFAGGAADGAEARRGSSRQPNRYPDAFALAATLTAVDAAKLRWHLSRLRRALREHLPALVRLVTEGKDSSTRPLILSHFLFFEFTGDGFRLVLYLDDVRRHRLTLVDWLMTFVTEVGGWQIPATIAAATGTQPATRLGRWNAPYPAADRSDPASWCAARVAQPGANPTQGCLVLRGELASELVTGSIEPDGVNVAFDVEAGDGHDTRTLGALVAALDARRRGDGARAVSYRDHPVMARLGPGQPSRFLQSPAIERALREGGRLLTGRAWVEGLMMLLVALLLSSTPPSTAVLVGAPLAVLGLGLVFGQFGLRMYCRYVFARLLPTLPRYHLHPTTNERARESLVRSAQRLRFGLAARRPWQRLRSTVRECGVIGAGFWIDLILRGPKSEIDAATRRKGLAQANRYWPGWMMMMMGVASYAVVAYVMLRKGAVRFDYLAGGKTTVPIVVTFAIGWSWNQCAFWRARKVPLYVLHMQERSYETILTEPAYRPRSGEIEVTARTGQYLDFVNGVTHLVVVGLIAAGVGYRHTGTAYLLGAAGLMLAIWSGSSSMQHLQEARRSALSWGRAFSRGWLWRDGKDLFSRARAPQVTGDPQAIQRDEVLPLDAMHASMHVMVARGDILADALRVAATLPGEAGRQRSLVVSTLPGHVLTVTGEPLAELGWTASTAPATVDHLLADGTFAAKVVNSWARYAEGVTIDLEVLAAGPVVDGRLDIVPVDLQVVPIRPNTLGGGYLALVSGGTREPISGRARPVGTSGNGAE